MLKIFGTHDDNTVKQMWTCLGVGSAVGGVLCADGHLGYAQPVGGVIAYEKHISVSGVGFDIGCGNCAARLDFTMKELRPRLDQIARDIQRHISFGIGRSNPEAVEHPLFDSAVWHEVYDDLDKTPRIRVKNADELRDVARNQLGTVGAGNHYVDLFEDEEGYAWIGVHFGSRGLGHKTATHFLSRAGGKDGMMVAPTVIESDSDLGARYLAAMELAGEYAMAGREWVVDRIRRLLAAKVTDKVHNHHNYAWRERHGDADYWVVRKGATPSFPGQRGFVGGSMGDDAVIIEGVETPENAEAFYSSIHGAGRLFGRNVAKKTFTREQMDEWLRQKGVILHGGDLDESPMAYRRLDDVLRSHEGTIKVLHRLRPVMVLMAGKDVRDPYKD